MPWMARAARADPLRRRATPFSLPVFGRAGFALVRTARGPFQGEIFERYRVASDGIGSRP